MIKGFPIMVSGKKLLATLILCNVTVSYSAASSCSPTPTVLGSWLYVVGSGNQFNGPLPSNWSTKHVAKGQFIFTSTQNGTWVWPIVSPTDANNCIRSTILNQQPFTVVVNMALCSSPTTPADLPFTLVVVGY